MLSSSEGEEKTRNFLQDAGLDCNCMDASSFEVLKVLVENDFSSIEIKRMTTSCSIIEPEYQQRGTETGFTLAQTTEERILKQLEYQTSLIQHLHKRVDELTQVVMNHGLPVTNNNHNDGYHEKDTVNPDEWSPDEKFHHYKSRREHPVRLPSDHVESIHSDEGPPNNQNRVSRDQQRQSQSTEEARDTDNNNNNRNTPISFFSAVFESVEMLYSKLTKTLQLFLALRRRQVPNLDVALILKTLFVVAIVMSRITRRKGVFQPLRFYLVGSIVILGFLYQLGYLSFLYDFFIKENYPGRIWEGEEIDVEEEVRNIGQPRQPPGEPDQQNNENDFLDWRQTLFGGRIHPPDLNQETNLLHVLQDIFLLVGTFFLSILPMWKPQRLDFHDNERDRDMEEPLPQVNPPDDPVEAEEDEEEEQEEEEVM